MGGVEGRGGGGGLQQHSRPKSVSPSFRMSDEIYKPTPRRCASVVRRLRRGCHEPLRGAAPRGVVVARQLSPASQGLLELCAFVFWFLCGEAGEERERESVCARMWMCKRLKEKHSLSQSQRIG